MDIIDAAQDITERINEAALSNRTKSPQLTPVGYCLNPLCQDDLADGKLFCDATCAREYERVTKRNRR